MDLKTLSPLHWQYLNNKFRENLQHGAVCNFYEVIMDTLGTFMFPLLIIGIFYMLVFRPQQKKMKEHQNMVGNLAKGDEVVTAGGMIGKVVKVKADSNEIEVELAKDVRVRIVQATISDVRNKTVPAKQKA
jgi:preprotein translocase subunit YajC|tara:strand:+ start:48 stop:440 length:393 start_codon:yes stop_codon:yes gene_type:complete